MRIRYVSWAFPCSAFQLIGNWFLARRLVLDAPRVTENWFSFAFTSVGIFPDGHQQSSVKFRWFSLSWGHPQPLVARKCHRGISRVASGLSQALSILAAGVFSPAFSNTRPFRPEFQERRPGNPGVHRRRGIYRTSTGNRRHRGLRFCTGAVILAELKQLGRSI